MALREPLIGRREELALLHDRLAEAVEGTGRLVLLSGSAGLGKTRVAEELIASAGGVLVGWGAAVDGAGMPPLWPWVRAVRHLPGPREALSAALSATAGAAIGSATDAAAAEFTAHSAVLDALEACAIDGGAMLLVLEDLHWADEASLRLLDRLAGAVRQYPILMMATSRPVSSGALAIALPRLLARPGADALRLTPLSPSDARELLIRAVADCDSGAVRAIVEGAGGNPLYLRTVARAAPHLLRDPTTDSAAAGRLPELRDLVVGAMRRCGPQAASALETLSALGADADLDTLAQVCGAASAADVLETISPAITAGLVTATPERVHFAHALVRDAVYASLHWARSAALHQRAAEVLERRAASERPDLAGEVAQHWLHAGQPIECSRWAVRGAMIASGAGAHQQAAGFLALALDTCPAGESGAEFDRLELLLALARALYLSGDLAASLTACERAANEGLRRGDRAAAARAAVIIQGVGDPDLIDQLDQLCVRALKALGGSAEPALRSQVEAQLAHVARERGDLAAAFDWSDRALKHAADSGALVAELDAICARGPLTLVPGQAVERLDLGQRAIELAQHLGRPLAELWGHVWRADAHAELADVSSAQGEVAALATLADRTGLPLVRWHLLRQQAAWAALGGDFEKSLDLSRASNEVADALGDESARGIHVAFLLFVAYLRRDPRGVPEGVVDTIPLAPRLPVVRASRAMALLMTGRVDEAAAAYRTVPLDTLDPENPISLRMILHAVELAIEFDDVPGCRRIAATLGVIRKRAPVVGSGTVMFLGSVARAQGRTELAAGSFEVAIPLLEEGIGVDAVLGARPYVVQGRLALAAALTQRAGAGDLPRARDLATLAASDARRLQMRGMVAEAETLLGAVETRTRAADPLTSREREVVALVAQALSNRDIADRLVLSERTVEGHVRSILAKTGLTSRAELIRHVMEESPRPRTVS